MDVEHCITLLRHQQGRAIVFVLIRQCWEAFTVGIVTERYAR